MNEYDSLNDFIKEVYHPDRNPNRGKYFMVNCKWYWAVINHKGVTCGMHPTWECAEEHLEILNNGL